MRMLQALQRIEDTPAEPARSAPAAAPPAPAAADPAPSPAPRAAPDPPPSPARKRKVPRPSARTAPPRRRKGLRERLAAQYERLAETIARQLPPERSVALAFGSAWECADSGGLLAPLAVALAERIRGATIAIDADFQRPTLAGHLGAPPERDGQGPGLSDVLRGDADWKEAVRPTGVDRLAVLPGGRSRPAGGHRFGPLLDELRARTPLLLVSLGPIAHSGAAELAGLCEGTCLFVALGRTTRREARAAVRALHAAGSLVLGSIAVG